MNYSYSSEWLMKMLHLDEHVTPSAGGPPMYMPKGENLSADERVTQNTSAAASPVKPKKAKASESAT